MAKDLDLMVRVTHALLDSLPRQIVAADGTTVSFIRRNEREMVAGDNVARRRSPLDTLQRRDDKMPLILVGFERRGVECMFCAGQVGLLRPELADVCPECASPFDDPNDDDDDDDGDDKKTDDDASDDLMIRVTHALLSSLPREIVADDGTRIKFHRLTDAEESDDPEPTPRVSPLHVNREHMTPEMLLTFERGGVGALFAIRQVGPLPRELADVCAECASPFDNPQ